MGGRLTTFTQKVKEVRTTLIIYKHCSGKQISIKPITFIIVLNNTHLLVFFLKKERDIPKPCKTRKTPKTQFNYIIRTLLCTSDTHSCRTRQCMRREPRVCKEEHRNLELCRNTRSNQWGISLLSIVKLSAVIFSFSSVCTSQLTYCLRQVITLSLQTVV
jgi:hypothetical protein